MGHPICSITTTTSGKNIVSGNGSRSWTRRPASLPYGTPSTQKKSSAGASSNPNDKSSILQHTSIEALQGRGVKFLSCHTATEEQVHAMAKEYFLKEPFENVVKDIQSHALPGVLIVPAMGRRLAAAVRWPLHLHHSVETKSVQMGTRVTLIPTALIISSCFFAQSSPPWSKGANNPAVEKGQVFQVADVDNVPDLHGNPAVSGWTATA